MPLFPIRRLAALLTTLLVAGTTAALTAPHATATTSTAGQRIIAVAKKYVGDRYTYDGASPAQGFDCSGYTMWVYGRAGVAVLPHDANRQRFVGRMHRESRANARPGDLIFYFEGSGPAYHVAIYAGNNRQYAATMPGEGVKYQQIWSRNIEFRTDWH